MTTDERQHPRQVRMTDAEHEATVADAKRAGFTHRGEGNFSEYVRHLVAKARKRGAK